MENPYTSTDNIIQLFNVLSKLNALRILFLAERGIENSTAAMAELGLTPKKYYSKLKTLLDADLINKIGGVHRQTPLGRIFHDYFIPAMSKACEVKEQLTILELLEGMSVENKIKNILEDDFNILNLAQSKKIRIIDDYESLVIDVIDIIDEAENEILLATNYFDVRVMEATLRAVDRGVTNRLIMGKKSLLPKIQKFRLMLSPSFMKTLINFASNTQVDIKEFAMLADIPYTFIVTDMNSNLIEISDTMKDRFIFALSIEDKSISEKLADLFETIWKTGDSYQIMKLFDELPTKTENFSVNSPLAHVR